MVLAAGPISRKQVAEISQPEALELLKACLRLRGKRMNWFLRAMKERVQTEQPLTRAQVATLQRIFKRGYA